MLRDHHRTLELLALKAYAVMRGNKIAAELRADIRETLAAINYVDPRKIDDEANDVEKRLPADWRAKP